MPTQNETPKVKNTESTKLKAKVDAMKLKIANDQARIAHLTAMKEADETILSQMEVKLNLLTRLEQL